ncbi:MAG: HAMP domain-containing histidine kinase [Planctomycetes bacterium]|nr:HAMP domain-containing histidine kinase [Planctomycetota bacterium]
MDEPKELVASAIARAQADLEVALAELEKMPAFDASSVAFAAHALNNYLTVAGGTVELLLLQLADYPDAQVRVWLEGVQHASNLMARIVSQLINTSANTETKLRFEKVDLALLVQRACNYYERVAERKTIRVIAGSTIDVPPVWTDRVAVAAVLDNLLSNAVKYSQPRKQIWVQVRGEKGWAVCSVRDEGPGLSQDDQAKLFQRGTRLTPKPTASESSTGYGLAVAKDLMEKLGGQIWCESVLGQGSCFSFRLPAFQEPAQGPCPDKAAPHAEPGKPGQ